MPATTTEQGGPLQTLLHAQGIAVIDGAMATELERRGAGIDDPLWSAKVLLEEPERIQEVHFDYFAAGADIAITASYQATFEGLAARGIGNDEAAGLMRRSVALADAARACFLALPEAKGRQAPLVAASVGPYGAYLHDGSEYRGDYGLTVAQLVTWHRPRFALLAASGTDLLACETIPCMEEAEALALLIDEYEVPAWLSVSCRDGDSLNHGEPIGRVTKLADATRHVVAVGVNCTQPSHVESLLRQIGRATTKPLLCYPNSGEGWDAATGCWLPSGEATNFGAAALRWHEAGARLIGGCCRTSPSDITAIRAALLPLHRAQ